MSLFSLSNDVMGMILQYSNENDLIRLASTTKHFLHFLSKIKDLLVWGAKINIFHFSNWKGLETLEICGLSSNTMISATIEDLPFLHMIKIVTQKKLQLHLFNVPQLSILSIVGASLDQLTIPHNLFHLHLQNIRYECEHKERPILTIPYVKDLSLHNVNIQVIAPTLYTLTIQAGSTHFVECPLLEKLIVNTNPHWQYKNLNWTQEFPKLQKIELRTATTEVPFFYFTSGFEKFVVQHGIKQNLVYISKYPLPNHIISTLKIRFPWITIKLFPYLTEQEIMQDIAFYCERHPNINVQQYVRKHLFPFIENHPKIRSFN